MKLSLNNLQSPEGQANKSRKRIGRGNAAGQGTYAGKGLKGQRARSGGSGGLKLRGLKARLMTIPKLRGFTSPHQKAATVNVADLEKHFEVNATVNPRLLLNKGLIKTPRHGVKILGDGELSKALTVEKCKLSKSAEEKIKQAGGNIK